MLGSLFVGHHPDNCDNPVVIDRNSSLFTTWGRQSRKVVLLVNQRVNLLLISWKVNQLVELLNQQNCKRKRLMLFKERQSKTNRPRQVKILPAAQVRTRFCTYSDSSWILYFLAFAYVLCMAYVLCCYKLFPHLTLYSRMTIHAGQALLFRM